MTDLPPISIRAARLLLVELGLPEELRAQQLVLREIISKLKQVGDLRGFSLEKVEAIRQGMIEADQLFEPLVERVEHAAATIREPGFRYNAKTKEVTYPPGKKGGQPKRLISEVIGKKWEVERPRYEAETGNKDYNSQALRDRVRDALRLQFPDNLLDASPGGLIDTSIRNYYARKTRDS